MEEQSPRGKLLSVITRTIRAAATSARGSRTHGPQIVNQLPACKVRSHVSQSAGRVKALTAFLPDRSSSSADAAPDFGKEQPGDCKHGWLASAVCLHARVGVLIYFGLSLIGGTVVVSFSTSFHPAWACARLTKLLCDGREGQRLSGAEGFINGTGGGQSQTALPEGS